MFEDVVFKKIFEEIVFFRDHRRAGFVAIRFFLLHPFINPLVVFIHDGTHPAAENPKEKSGEKPPVPAHVEKIIRHEEGRFPLLDHISAQIIQLARADIQIDVFISVLLGLIIPENDIVVIKRERIKDAGLIEKNFAETLFIKEAVSHDGFAVEVREMGPIVAGLFADVEGRFQFASPLNVNFIARKIHGFVVLLNSKRFKAGCHFQTDRKFKPAITCRL